MSNRQFLTISNVAILAISFITIMGCNNTAVKEQEQPKTVEGGATNAKDSISSKVDVKDKSLYHPDFIKGLANYHEAVKLIDNAIITGSDTTSFPEDLPLQQKVVFKGQNDRFTISLELTRVNLTDLKYLLAYTSLSDQKTFRQSGKAILGSLFFLASEIDEDTDTGDGYTSTAYGDKSKNCTLTIRVELGKDEQHKQRAMLEYECTDQGDAKINLDECPTLRMQ